MEHHFKVSEVAKLLNKSEETIKRWIRSGHFPNAIKESDKKGWRIPEEDLRAYLITTVIDPPSQESKTAEVHLQKSPQDEGELVILAYEAVTMTSPTEEIIGLLSHEGIKRTLEILLVMQQSPKKVKNPIGFIKRAISEGWTPTTLPIKKHRNVARIPREYSEENSTHYKYPEQNSPFYNWLDK